LTPARRFIADGRGAFARPAEPKKTFFRASKRPDAKGVRPLLQKASPRRSLIFVIKMIRFGATGFVPQRTSISAVDTLSV
jgi:hypothetical protein